MWAGLITPPRRVSFLSAARQSAIVRAVFRPPWGAQGQSLAPVFAFAGARGRGLPGVLPPPAFGRLRPRFAVPTPGEEERRPRRAILERSSGGRLSTTTCSSPKRRRRKIGRVSLVEAVIRGSRPAGYCATSMRRSTTPRSSPPASRRLPAGEARPRSRLCAPWPKRATRRRGARGVV